jgi:hypothetical protein
MANISGLLTKILTAIYGSELRQALHDAIKTTNDGLESETEERQTADASMRGNIAGLVTAVDDLNAPDTKYIDVSVMRNGMPTSVAVYSGEAKQVNFGVCEYVGTTQSYEMGPPDVPCSFCFHFESGDEPTSLNFYLPFGGWFFEGGEPPEIKAETKYTCVILYTGLDNGPKYRVSLGAFG